MSTVQSLIFHKVTNNLNVRTYFVNENRNKKEVNVVDQILIDGSDENGFLNPSGWHLESYSSFDLEKDLNPESWHLKPMLTTKKTGKIDM